MAKAAQQAGQLDEHVADLQAQQLQMLQFNEVTIRPRVQIVSTVFLQIWQFCQDIVSQDGVILSCMLASMHLRNWQMLGHIKAESL